MPGIPTQPTSDDKQLAAHRILAVTEQELQMLVLDIHDGVVQNLFAAQTQLSIMKRRREDGQTIPDADFDEHLVRVFGLLDEALQEIRNFLGTFRSPNFAEREIADMIQSLISTHESFTGCQVQLTYDDQQLEVSLPVKIALYRICQEALANAYQHAGTNRQWIRLEKEHEMIRLEIRDQGRGFVPPPMKGLEATEREEHIGLRGMRDRVGLMGGRFELHSTPGKGTRIVIWAPADG